MTASPKILFRLVALTVDGQTRTSDFSGYDSETGAYHFFRQAQKNPCVMSAAVFEGVSEKFLSVRSMWSAADDGKRMEVSLPLHSERLATVKVVGLQTSKAEGNGI